MKRRRYTIRWNPYPTPLYRRLMTARMWEQVRMWRNAAKFWR